MECMSAFKVVELCSFVNNKHVYYTMYNMIHLKLARNTVLVQKKVTVKIYLANAYVEIKSSLHIT